MDKSTLINIFDFLQRVENKTHKDSDSIQWKLMFEEPLIKEELIIYDDLDLTNLDITSLPEGLEVKGNLYLDNLNILSLPKGLKVEGDLSSTGCKNLKSLPIGIEVKGAIHLSDCTSLTSLPEGLEVGGWLWLDDCKSLKSLPKGLKVDGRLIISNTPLAKLSDETILSMIEPDGYINGEILKR
jgi:hypothetical protein